MKIMSHTAYRNPLEHSSCRAVWPGCLSINNLHISNGSTKSISLWCTKEETPLVYLQIQIWSTSMFFQRRMRYKWWILLPFHKDYQLIKKPLLLERFLQTKTYYKNHILWTPPDLCSRIQSTLPHENNTTIPVYVYVCVYISRGMIS